MMSRGGQWSGWQAPQGVQPASDHHPAPLHRLEAGVGGRRERHLLYVVIVHEADEDAVVGVVPGDAGNHGDLTLLAGVAIAGGGRRVVLPGGLGGLR